MLSNILIILSSCRESAVCLLRSRRVYPATCISPFLSVAFSPPSSTRTHSVNIALQILYYRSDVYVRISSVKEVKHLSNYAFGLYCIRWISSENAMQCPVDSYYRRWCNNLYKQLMITCSSGLGQYWRDTSRIFHEYS